MNRMERLEQAEARRLSPDARQVTVGNTVRVHVRIIEGEKERIQVFEGVVIREQGARNRKTFTVRKTSYGVWVERVFPLYSPFVTRIDVMRVAPVHRAKLYYLRQRTGRAARLGEKDRTSTPLARAAVAPVMETPEAPIVSPTTESTTESV